LGAGAKDIMDQRQASLAFSPILNA